MNLSALIIDDDPAIRQVLEDRLDVMEHRHDSAGSVTEAKALFRAFKYDYFLLDMELPDAFPKPSSVDNGKYLLREIKRSKMNANAPVLVITGHGLDSTDLPVELYRMGAADFIKKPFGTDIIELIRSALLRSGLNPDPYPQSDSATAVPSNQLKLVIHSDRAELNHVEICRPENGAIWRILRLLNQLGEDGRPVSFQGKDIVNTLDLTGGQNSVSGTIARFRKRIAQRLSGEDVPCGLYSIIDEGVGAAYRLAPSLATEDRSGLPMETVRLSDQRSRPPERKEWIIEQLAAQGRLRREDLERHFGISEPTAKRDLRALSDKIKFVGKGGEGYYALK